MRASNKKNKKIITLFLFGIGLPSILLAYFAFRGIENDRALLEKEARNELGQMATQVTSDVNNIIKEEEQTFFSFLAGHNNSSQSYFIHSLDSLKKKHPLVEEVFYFNKLERIQFPLAKLLFLPDESIHPTNALTLDQSSMKAIINARISEFQEKKYQKALADYKQAFSQTTNTNQKGELLNAIARVQSELKLVNEAQITYREISKNYNRVRTRGNIPLGLTARLELGSLLFSHKDSLNALRTYIKSYSELIQGEWKLERSQYAFYSQRIQKSINDILQTAFLTSPMHSYQRTFTNLKKDENEYRKSTEKLLNFKKDAVNELRSRVLQNPENIVNKVNRFTLQLDGSTYFVSMLPRQSGSLGQQNRIWGLLIDANYLKNNLLSHELQHRGSSKSTGWLVRGEEGNTILKSKSIPVGAISFKTNFIANFPPWIVEFRQRDPGIFESFLSSRKSIYFYMFILIAGILIFGLIISVRAVTHEMETVKMKSDFVSTISHEFKSPLTSIRQLAEMLKNNRVPSEERRHRYYDILVEQSRRLSLLIDNILDFSKMEEGKKEFYFEEIELNSLVEEIVSTSQERVQHEGFIIQKKIDNSLPKISGDRIAISQALNNLIDNAIKYSGQSKKIIVRTFRDEQYLTITVQDFGIGIRKEEVNKVFERFYRGGDELTRSVKGSGIGLTLVKQIVDAHHGKIYVDSEPGKGSTFFIKLPILMKND